MEINNYNDEFYMKNLEQAVKLREKFIRFRNMMIYFITCAAGYSFALPTIKNGWIIFISLVVMYAIVALAMKIFDELRYSISVHRNERKQTRTKTNKVKTLD